jgi:putative DNA primase/helicase
VLFRSKEKIPTGDIVEAMTVVAHQHPFHPIQDYLDSLKWDGIERIPDFCSDFFGSAKDPYHIAVGKSFFVSSVARIYKPGAKVDTMVILQSPQGMRKTATWQALFGEFCSEVTSSLNDKDFFSGLRGVWCADFGELDQFSKAEVTRIKQVITQTFDHYRPHYGRQHQRFPRQCVFVGGTNQDNWQTDATGARRYLPVDVKHVIDVEAIAAIRDQLWAEAVARFRRGETWWHIPDAPEHQEKSYVGDTWEEIIGQWLREEYMKPQIPDETFAFLLGSVLNNALKIDPGKQTKSDQTRAGNAMRRLGWSSRQTMIAGQRVRVYYPSPDWIATHDAIKQEAARQGF